MKNVFIVFVILLTSSCGNQTIRPDKTQYQGLDLAQSYYQSLDYRNAAAEYTQLYNTYGKDEFAVYAADSWLQSHDYQQAGHYLSQVKNSTMPLFKIVQAELFIKSGKYNFNLNSINGKLRPRYLILLATLENHRRNYLNAALTLIELTELDPTADVTNTIINNLLQVPENKISQGLFNLDISVRQQGWLEATYIATSQDQDAISQWQQRWQNHPANQFFAQESNYTNIAVLLPLTGKYKNISKSIQQGMMAALYRNNSEQQQLAFFNTGSNGEFFSNAWYGAIESGAEFIIGPLEKKSVQQLAQMNSATVPIMLLNQLDSENNPYGYYQFALSKEDEVTNVANRLILENKKRIILLAPETDAGRKLAKHFEDEYSYKGGQLVSYAFYPENTHDYSQEIKQSLGLNDSKIRARNLQTIIGTKISNTPQIRPDIDAIFVIAKPKNARLLKPQLKFFQAENIPVYATSQIQSGSIDTAIDKDLNGINFCQSAFTIDSGSLQGMLDFDASKIKSNKKFFAFGYDAIAIYPRLEWMQRVQSQKVAGISGKLSVDGNGKVHRELAWAQYQNGKPQLLPSIEPQIREGSTIVND